MLINIIVALLTKNKKISKDFDKKLLEKFYVKGSKVIFKGFVKYFVSHKDHNSWKMLDSWIKFFKGQHC